MELLKTPEEFDFSLVASWPDWIKKFELFADISGMDLKDDSKKVKLLLYLMGGKSSDVFESFKLKEEDRKVYDKVKNAFETYFVGKRNIIYERTRFNRRVQREAESIDEFITDLHVIAKYCNYGTLKDELIRDRIVAGMLDQKLSEKLQMEVSLTLEQTITRARLSESVKKQQSEMHDGESVDRLKVKQKSGLSSNNPKWKCYFCGGRNKHEKASCPAKSTLCNSCNQVGHWARVCSARQKTSEVNEVEEEDDEFGFLDTVRVDAVDSRSMWLAEIEVGKVPVQFKLDPGADVTVIPSLVYHKKFKKQFRSLIPSHKKLFGPGGEELKTLGYFHSSLQHKGHVTKSNIYVIAGLHRGLLGRDNCETLNLVKRIEDVSCGSRVSPKKEVPKLFHRLGTLNHTPNHRLGEIVKAQSEDVCCKTLIKYCSEGWPVRENLSHDLKPYYRYRDELSMVGGILMWGIRIFIPAHMRRVILEKIHKGHLGIKKKKPINSKLLNSKLVDQNLLKEKEEEGKISQQYNQQPSVSAKDDLKPGRKSPFLNHGHKQATVKPISVKSPSSSPEASPSTQIPKVHAETKFLTSTKSGRVINKPDSYGDSVSY